MLDEKQIEKNRKKNDKFVKKYVKGIKKKEVKCECCPNKASFIVKSVEGRKVSLCKDCKDLWTFI